MGDPLRQLLDDTRVIVTDLAAATGYEVVSGRERFGVVEWTLRIPAGADEKIGRFFTFFVLPHDLAWGDPACDFEIWAIATDGRHFFREQLYHRAFKQVTNIDAHQNHIEELVTDYVWPGPEALAEEYLPHISPDRVAEIVGDSFSPGS